ncbi:GH15107 [Drosophila grimshawi]|uniref:RNA exonuclease 4 n=2 Tax=Drosophila grimshawi TaxID=7222 RepID=B4IYS3_DROGR|nr:GH15107 [Drosophila grimshawi]
MNRAKNNNQINSPGQRKLQNSMERLELQQSNINRRAAGSNWQSSITAATGTENQKQSAAAADGEVLVAGDAPLTKSARARLKRKAQRNRYLAMDCEMVGVSHNGCEDMLARVSIVNKRGEVLLDKYVKPRQPVVDYRTSVSGIRPHDIENGEDFKAVQAEVAKMLQGKILVGHALRKDLGVLSIKHPVAHIRDTSRYKPLCKLVSNGHTPSLKRLTLSVLGQEIQTGEHSSVEDARAAMGVYNRIAADWERHIQKQQKQQHHI